MGRRGTKSRFALIAGVAGHGPGRDGARQFPGIMEGGDVVWVAQDYPNLTTVMWREEFVPRFGHLPWVTLNAQDHFVSVRGRGTLYLRSAEAISGIRGIGKKLRGVIVDEAAHLDLERGLLDVILPACLDNDAWLILMSTTNAGADGNVAHRVPSYFNLICEEIRAGERSEEWEEFTGTAYDNPSLTASGIDELVAEYPEGSPALRQEVFAELLRAGIGLALPQIDEEHHLIPRQPIPMHWTRFGAFDWGYNHPYCFGDFACDEDGNVLLVDTLWGREEFPDQIAQKIAKTFRMKQFRYIVAGHDCWNEVKARGENTPTIFETMHQNGVTMMKANISRVTGLSNLAVYTQWQATDTHKERTPRFRMLDTEGNRRVLKQLQMMQRDPKDPEDALKVDADAAGKGGDDGYDMVRYGLASRPLRAIPEPGGRPSADRGTPYDYKLKAFQERQDTARADEEGRMAPRYTSPRFRGGEAKPIADED